MRYLIIFAIILTIAAFGVFGFGANLPETHEVTKKAIYNQPQGVVWDAVSDYATMASWSPGIDSIKRLDDVDGKPLWRFTGEDGHVMDILVMKEEAPMLHVSKIHDTDLPFGGTWTITVKAVEDDKTLVTLTEEGTIESPVWRFITHFMMGYDAMAIQFLQALGSKFDETPDVE